MAGVNVEIGGVIAGALLAGVFGLLGALYVKTLEGRHWLRDRRLEAYSDFLGEVDTLALVNLEGDPDAAAEEDDTVRFNELVRSVQRRRARLELLGPQPIADASLTTFEAALDARSDRSGKLPFRETRYDFVTAAAAELRMKRWFKRRTSPDDLAGAPRPASSPEAT